MKIMRVIGILGLLVAACSAATAPVSEHALLLRAYFHVMLIQQMPAQVRHVTQAVPEADAAQIQEALTVWMQTQLATTRAELTTRLGEQSRERFEQFVADYSVAESKGNIRFLTTMVAGLGLEQNPPQTYQALHEFVTTTLLKADLQTASKFLSDLQTWLKLKTNTPDMPPLQAWLNRDQALDAAPKSAPAVAPAPSRAQLLAEREAAPAEFKPEAETSPSARETYAAARKERQARRMEVAQAGMQQVAAERQSAEQEQAAQKTTMAQAEAEAIKNQAQKLAAVEKQAMEQQQNSWGNKLKAIVGTTISAAGGAFFGGVGAQAGQLASDALFSR
ncbi:MAG: hypothetical protein NTY53_17655 [Kiritimatiellaeota bacterium]|nr:hypothetical protein [Kiritimatiellota bacterium]